MVKGDFIFQVDKSSASSLVSKLLAKAEELIVRKHEDEFEITARNIDIDEIIALKLALLYPEANVKMLGEKGEEQFQLDLPARISGILRCPNQNCVTSQPKEPALPEFIVVSRNPLVLLCSYCGRYVYRNMINEDFFLM